MTNKKLAEQLRNIAISLFDKTYDANFKLLLDEASDRLERQGEWISVEEKLPEENTRVLVYLGKAPEHHATKTDTDRIYRGTWVRWSGSITHWMPLPEAPKNKEAQP